MKLNPVEPIQTQKRGEIMYKNSARDPTKAIKKLGTQSVRVSVLGALGNENRGTTRQNSNSPRFLMQMSRFKGAAT